MLISPSSRLCPFLLIARNWQRCVLLSLATCALQPRAELQPASHQCTASLSSLAVNSKYHKKTRNAPNLEQYCKRWRRSASSSDHREHVHLLCTKTIRGGGGGGAQNQVHIIVKPMIRHMVDGGGYKELRASRACGRSTARPRDRYLIQVEQMRKTAGLLLILLFCCELLRLHIIALLHISLYLVYVYYIPTSFIITLSELAFCLVSISL